MRMLALLGALYASSAHSAPPPVGSDDWNTMAPYKSWIEKETNAKGWICCSIADGRPVEAHIVGDHWEAHITPEHFPEQKDRWVVIEERIITRHANPTGLPILWLYQGEPRCFAPPDGV